MKIIRNLNITTEEFYSYLKKQILNDINKNIEPKNEKKEIKTGSEYKIYDKKTKMTQIIKINDYTFGKKFEVTYLNSLEKIRVEYVTKKIGKKTQVILNENIESFESDKQNSLLGLIGKIMMLGRMSSGVLDIESKIIDARNDEK